MILTEDEIIAAIFAIEHYKTKALRDKDRLREDHKNSLRRVLQKLRDELDRLENPQTKEPAM